MTELITSKDNEKLKLVRKLQQRRHRDREGLFVTEGEDLLEAGVAAGVEPVALLTLEGEGLGGEEVSGDALASASTLGSGTRAIAVWQQAWAPVEGPVCVYLHGVADPGNVGAIVRTANALVTGTVVLGPECADPYGPKAVRATMGAIFTQPLARAGIEETPTPRIALVAHGGKPIEEWATYYDYVERSRPSTDQPPESHPNASPTQPQSVLTLVLGSERAGVPPELLESTDASFTIPLRDDAAESLNVAAAAAIALQRISSEAARA
jgi:RNA methyltransferase, TrmH family